MTEGGASTADKVKYDNSNSGLGATNIQGAIDEVNACLGNVQKIDCGTKTCSSGNGAIDINIDVSKDGLTPICVVGFNIVGASKKFAELNTFYIEDNILHMQIVNRGSSNYSWTYYAYVLYK